MQNIDYTVDHALYFWIKASTFSMLSFMDMDIVNIEYNSRGPVCLTVLSYMKSAQPLPMSTFL